MINNNNPDGPKQPFEIGILEPSGGVDVGGEEPRGQVDGISHEPEGQK
jgi:hypothetical protein